MIGNVIFISGMLLLGGCAFTPQRANLSFDPNFISSEIGRGQKIALKVVDERPTIVLGHRGAGFGKGAEITTDQDIPKMIHEQVAAGLKVQGFEPVEDKQAVKQLKIEIRTIEYSTSTGFMTGGIQLNVALKGIAANGAKAYEKLYRTNDEKRVFFVPFAADNEKMINGVVTKTLQQIFDDKELLDFLSN